LFSPKISFQLQPFIRRRRSQIIVNFIENNRL